MYISPPSQSQLNAPDQLKEAERFCRWSRSRSKTLVPSFGYVLEPYLEWLLSYFPPDVHSGVLMFQYRMLVFNMYLRA